MTVAQTPAEPQVPTEEQDTVEGFIVTRQWRDALGKGGVGRARHLQLTFWITTDQGPLRLVIDQQQPLFFLAASERSDAETVLAKLFGRSASHPSHTPTWTIKPLGLKNFRQQPVVGVYFREQHHVYRARDAMEKVGLTPLEADINPADRFLMERFITGGVKASGVITDCQGVREIHNPQLQCGDYSPYYSVVSLDIETSMNADTLFSIGVLLKTTDPASELNQRWVFMVGQDTDLSAQEQQQKPDYLNFFSDEKSLLLGFLQWFEDVDADIIIGWNVINFDLRVLQNKADELGVKFTLGRNRAFIDWRESRDVATRNEHFTLCVPGRLVLDGIDTLKSATYSFESFSLQSVAETVLGRGKLSDDVDNRGAAISAQFMTNKLALAAYNLEDCQLVWDIFLSTQLFDFAIERARLTGLAMDRFGGSVAAFDNRYLPRLHRAGYVAPRLQENPEGVGSPGGYVMDSKPGIYRHVLVLDFKSLYPSIIRTFKIDPLARVAAIASELPEGTNTSPSISVDEERIRDQLETENVNRTVAVPGFNGAVFAKDKALLPDIIGELWAARDEAKQRRNSAMSQAIKIIMNSFYGVLGTPGCRFFDYRLPSSITLRGHEILTHSKTLIEAAGHRVIYGDTDSVFVCLADGNALDRDGIQSMGQQLAQTLNNWWQDYLWQEYQLNSHLEIEFETHYQQFVMPTIRGSDSGSKKRYAGVVQDDNGNAEIIFKGLEAVRTDWTPLARGFQRELYRRIFAGERYEAYILDLVEQVQRGEVDDQLHYRKRIRRRLADYRRNVPPHVQAARLADAWLAEQGQAARYSRGGWITYVLTTAGPQPLECITASLDYDLYIERQLAPVADGILQFIGVSFEQLVDQQLGLF